MTRLNLTLLVLLVTGCADTDPYRRSDVWYPSGANAGNIAAMAARPSDLVLGRSGNTGDARQDAGSIDRIWQDRPKPLSSSADSAPAAGGAAPPAGSN
jgi:type IV pilus biogenesis protein CpaD/CtpE